MAPPKLTVIKGEGWPRRTFTVAEADELMRGIPDSLIREHANTTAQRIIDVMIRTYEQSLGPRRLRLLEGGRKD